MASVRYISDRSADDNPAGGTQQSFAVPFCPISFIGTGHISCRSRTSKCCIYIKCTTSWRTYHLKESVFAVSGICAISGRLRTAGSLTRTEIRRINALICTLPYG